MWYGLYKRQKSFAEDNDLENGVTSSMIWGSQYDAMLNWMTNSGKDVTEAGSSTNKNTTRVTGTKLADKINNVFDLRGNSQEWDLEAYRPDCRT